MTSRPSAPGPRSTIPAPLGVRDDVVVDVVQARFTEAELRAAQQAVFSGSQIPGLIGGGLGVQQNLLSFDLVDPPDETLDRLAERVDPAMACVTITRTEPPPTGPLQILSEDPADQLLSCGGSRGPFPVSVLDAAVPLGESDHPAAVVLAEELAGTGNGMALELSTMYSDGVEFAVLMVEDDTVLFGAFDPAGQLEGSLSVDRAGENWRLSSFGGCDLQVAYPDGLGRVVVGLDPDIGPPGPDATVLDLAVNERDCASGQAMGDRLVGPQVVETEESVTIVFAATPVPGSADCPGNPWTRATVNLSAPLGQRVLLDGGVFPPAPLAPADVES